MSLPQSKPMADMSILPLDLSELKKHGLTLVLTGDNLRLIAKVNVSPTLKEQIKKAKPSLVALLQAERNVRQKELALKLDYWQGQCSADQGYDWSLTNWLTDDMQAHLDDVIAKYLSNELELTDVHQSFLAYSRAHKRTKKVLTLSGKAMTRYQNKWCGVEVVKKAIEAGEVLSHMATCVSPQWEPDSQTLVQMCRVFQFSEQEYKEGKQ